METIEVMTIINTILLLMILFRGLAVRMYNVLRTVKIRQKRMPLNEEYTEFRSVGWLVEYVPRGGQYYKILFQYTNGKFYLG